MYDVKPVTSKGQLDCGPACLKMLLDYYGIDVPLDQLTEECSPKLVGTTAADLMRVGREHGLSMQCYSMDADELVRQDRPAIVFWRYQHWCVFAGTDEGGRVWLCNPSRGRYRVEYDTFAKLLSGIKSHPDQGVCIWHGDPADLVPVAPDNIPAETIFELNGTYYRAITAIARGETITRANATVTSVDAVLNDLEARGQG